MHSHESAFCMSGKHLEALGQRLLCAWGSSSSSGTVVKLMRAESGVLPRALLLRPLGPSGCKKPPKTNTLPRTSSGA